jgi:lipopolysaccharide/colanic/teichoic acid biosynthesis glycosyltransferase
MIPQVLGTVEHLPSLCRARVIDEVVVASTLEPRVLEQLSTWCSVRGITMRMLVEAPSTGVGVWHAEHFGEGVFMLSLATIPQAPFQLALKRVIDVAGSTVGLVLFAIAWLWYGRNLRRETEGSALFRQQRVGQNGRRFTLYKLRTMRVGADLQKAQLAGQNAMNGPIFKLKDDPRITPTGRLLRQRHIDELPQFWNVLKGDMSLVGTRPPTEDEVDIYSEHHHRRLSMKPGITGLWQLNGNGKVSDFEEVVKLDCQYIDHWSLWLDLKILAKTISKVLRADAW